MTDTELNLYERLQKITEAAGVEKTGKAAPQMGGYAFHKIDDIEAMLKPMFVRFGVLCTVDVTNMEFQREGKDNIATCRVAITFRRTDKPDETLTINSYGQGFDRSDKAVGKAISYACKNAYLSVFHLKGQPDPEAETQAPSHTEPPPQRDPDKMTIPSGKYSGKTVDEIEDIAWLEKAAEAKNPTLADAAKARLKVLDAEIPF